MQITLFYCVQVAFYLYTRRSQPNMFSNRLFFVSSSSPTCMMLCINVISRCFSPFSADSLCLSAMSFGVKQWHQALLIRLHCFRPVLQHKKCARTRAVATARNVDEEFMATRRYIMNEYFQQLKCKKEGLCVYAVLK